MAAPQKTFDELYQSAWLARSPLFTNAFLSSSLHPIAGPLGTKGQLIPGHAGAKRASSVNSDASLIKLDAPFDDAKFSFDKVKEGEKIAVLRRDLECSFLGERGGSVGPQIKPHEIHENGMHKNGSLNGDLCPSGDAEILINLSPVTPFHGLLVPEPKACHSQRIDAYWKLKLPLDFVCLLAAREDARMLFNSLGGWASVNHLHYHLTYIGELFPNHGGRYPLECVERQELGRREIEGETIVLEQTTGWPLPAIVFSLHASKADDALLSSALSLLAKSALPLVRHLVESQTAHNIIFTPFPAVIIVPRRHQKTIGFPPGEFAVAVAEISGMPIFSDMEEVDECDEDVFRKVVGWYKLEVEKWEACLGRAKEGVEALDA